MRATFLIAGNFLREQRWYVVLLLVWVFGVAGILGLAGKPAGDDVMFFVRQQAGYGLALTTFMAAAAIQNDRRSRRILSILSKAVERREYLAGLLAGSVLLSVMFFTATALAASALSLRLGWATSAAWEFALPLIAAGALLASIALFFATFLHPLLATLATAVTVGAQLALERALGGGPMFDIARSLAAFHFQPQWHWPLGAACLAIAEAVILWLAAARIFALRDIAVAVE